MSAQEGRAYAQEWDWLSSRSAGQQVSRELETVFSFMGVQGNRSRAGRKGVLNAPLVK
jgi:hypothetical protein